MLLDRYEYSDTNFRSMDDLSSNSHKGVSNSATRPSLSTRTRPLSITVGIRCAMVSIMQALNSSNNHLDKIRIIIWIRLSVAVSTNVIASSSTSFLTTLIELNQEKQVIVVLHSNCLHFL
ncbi:unnamed protein product [Vicia faba]|uniref:Uncharacterized protein n=1 Tax=Vicia faba TaxID=3906 RepID=A0AAV0ZTM7_VICFA|nr:unnamed protein product [Vicia faba]